MSSARMRSRGMALVAVLWIIAALSVLVTGMVGAQRDEIRIVASSRDAVEGGALGSAAVQLVLQELARRPQPVTRLSRVEVQYANVAMPVEIIPLNGYIDLNRAPPPLLSALFAVAGGLPENSARALADTIVAARQPGPASQGGPRFEAVEDLLQVPGVDYLLYARLSRLLTTDAMGTGRVNPLAAPHDVLLVLAGGNAGRAAAIAAARDSEAAGVDTTGLPAQFVESAPATRFRLVAHVPLADGRHLLSVRMVEMGRASPDAVPWRIFQAEDRIDTGPAVVN